jgi:hypothetical protein
MPVGTFAVPYYEVLQLKGTETQGEVTIGFVNH